MSVAFDPATLALLRTTLDDILRSPCFQRSRSMSKLAIAEHLLSQASLGERDAKRLIASALGLIEETNTGAV